MFASNVYQTPEDPDHYPIYRGHAEVTTVTRGPELLRTFVVGSKPSDQGNRHPMAGLCGAAVSDVVSGGEMSFETRHHDMGPLRGV